MTIHNFSGLLSKKKSRTTDLEVCTGCVSWFRYEWEWMCIISPFVLLLRYLNHFPHRNREICISVNGTSFSPSCIVWKVRRTIQMCIVLFSFKTICHSRKWVKLFEFDCFSNERWSCTLERKVSYHYDLEFVPNTVWGNNNFAGCWNFQQTYR